MLEVLLSSTKKKEKMQQLEGYGLKMTTELEGCVSDMCNISEAILERALEEGLEKGLEQGLEQGIEKNQLDNIVKLMKKLSLTEEEAMDMLDIDEEHRQRYRKKINC
jgi:predicted transposase YdaD